ncbi:MAG TPA: TetR/AcrR family transcriptional regulator [Thermodesulfobacteriota bacterium]
MTTPTPGRGLDTRARRGRPRSEAARRAILSAAERLFREGGFGAVSVDAIAAAAGVSKATVYRWWPNKAAVLLESVVGRMRPLADYRDAPTLREKFRRQLADTARYLTTAEGAPVIALIAAKQGDPQLAREFAERYAIPRRARLRAMVTEGVRRGELRPVKDIDALIDMIYGPIYYRILVTGRPVDDAFVDTVVDSAFERIERR